MDNKKKPIITAKPDLSGTTGVAMDKKNFDALIYNDGYSLYIDRAVKCPCKSQNIPNNLPTCKNCGSTGWVFINRTAIKGIVYSMSWENSYKEWSEENLGNVFISTRHEDKLSFMDRVTVVDAETIHKQILYPFLYKGVALAFTTYSIKKIIDIFLYVNDQTPLRLLVENTDYTIGGANTIGTCNGLSDNLLTFSAEIIQLLESLNNGLHLSITYIHPPQYHITHNLRDTMVSIQKNGKPAKMPVSAVGRRSHYVLDAENYSKDRLLDNSYNPNSCPI